MTELSFISEEHRLYFEEARLGERAREFFSTELGQYVLGRAKGEMDEVKAEVMGINPYSPFARRKLARCRAKHDVAERAVQWLAQAIGNGDAAFQAMQELEAGS